MLRHRQQCDAAGSGIPFQELPSGIDPTLPLVEICKLASRRTRSQSACYSQHILCCFSGAGRGGNDYRLVGVELQVRVLLYACTYGIQQLLE